MKTYGGVLQTSALLIASNFLFILASPRKGGSDAAKNPLWKKLGPKHGDDGSLAKVHQFCTPFFESDSAMSEFESCATTFKVSLESLVPVSQQTPNPTGSVDEASKLAAAELKKHGFEFFENQLEMPAEMKYIVETYTNIGKEGSVSHTHRGPMNLIPSVLHLFAEEPCFGECLAKAAGVINPNGTTNMTFAMERFSAISNGEMPTNTTNVIIEYCYNKVGQPNNTQKLIKLNKENADPAKQVCWLNTHANMCISRFSWEVCQYYALQDKEKDSQVTDDPTK